MLLGPWPDPEMARDIKMLALLLLAPLTLAVALAILMRLRGGAKGLPGDDAETPHRGPNMSRIPLAGFPGLLFVAGYVWMFWFGVPGYRPVVVAAAVLGACGGAILVLLARRHRTPTSTPLGLRSAQAATAEAVNIKSEVRERRRRTSG
jgi:hypothetical protein